MAMQFWEAKRRHGRRTLLYLGVFFILTCIVALLFDFVMRFFAADGITPPIPYPGAWMMGFIFLVSLGYYLAYKTSGGKMVATSMGGWEADPASHSAKERELIHIVEEIAIASRLPRPPVYIIKANEINAFAAGTSVKNSIIAVTTGALTSLSREELQGVIAHEFGHIASGDMKVGLRLAALLMGFFILFYIGLRMLEGSFFTRGEKRGNSVALIALLLLLCGVVLWFAGSILRACVSREREYSADASAVEYTRNPQGIASALAKIKSVNEEKRDMPKSGLSYTHLYFDNRHFLGRLFATHPPIDKRIKAILGKDRG